MNIVSKKEILKSVVTEVSIGTLKIEGILVEDSQFAIAQQQIAALFSVIPTNTPKWLRSKLGRDIQLFLVKTDRNKDTRQNRPERALSLIDFEKLVFELAIEQNSVAISIARHLIGLSLTQLFSDAFGLKFEAEDRQQYLIHRQIHRDNFHPTYTSWLKKDGCISGYEYAREVNRLKSALNLPLMSINTYSQEQLAKLNIGESRYDASRKAGLNHSDSIKNSFN